MIDLSATPTKFGSGVGLFWRGIDLRILNAIILSSLNSYLAQKIPHLPSKLLFESARSALFHILIVTGVGHGDDVIVSAFTCSAVTYAVAQTGARVVYVDINKDLTMNSTSLFSAVTSKTKAVIVQNTFGRLGIEPHVFSKIKEYGILTIEDCALSFGSRLDDRAHGVFGDVSIWSLESSKSLTLGWGGVLTINNQTLVKDVTSYYQKLRRVPLLVDALRIFQLWISVYFTGHPSIFGPIIWYLLYGTRIFRRSRDSENNYYAMHSKMGILSCILFCSFEQHFGRLFKRSETYYRKFTQKALDLNLNCVVVPRSNESIVSPRFSLLVPESSRQTIIRNGLKLGVEIGDWFNEAPPSSNLFSNHSLFHSNASNISRSIINVSCHWSLSLSEVNNIMKWMETISCFDTKHTLPLITISSI
jgi:dTDP-4-amino-4,6-dideoxygalactose transaminase